MIRNSKFSKVSAIATEMNKTNKAIGISIAYLALAAIPETGGGGGHFLKSDLD